MAKEATLTVEGEIGESIGRETLEGDRVMGGTPDSSRRAIKPFLIARDEDGNVRLTLRETRYNGQGYPIVTTTLHDEPFPTATAARAYAKEHFGAEPGQFASK